MRLSRSWQLSVAPALFDDPEVMRRCSPGCRAVRVEGPGFFVLELAVPQLRGVVLNVELRQRWEEGKLLVEAFSLSPVGTVTARGVWKCEPLSVEGEAWLGGGLATVGQRVVEPLARRWLDEFVERLGREASK